MAAAQQRVEAIAEAAAGKGAVGSLYGILVLYGAHADAQRFGLVPGGGPGGDEFLFHVHAPLYMISFIVLAFGWNYKTIVR